MSLEVTKEQNEIKLSDDSVKHKSTNEPKKDKRRKKPRKKTLEN